MSFSYITVVYSWFVIIFELESNQQILLNMNDIEKYTDLFRKTDDIIKIVKNH